MKLTKNARDARLREEFLAEVTYAVTDLFQKVRALRDELVDARQLETVAKAVADLAISSAANCRQLDRLERLADPTKSEPPLKRTILDHIRGGANHV